MISVVAEVDTTLLAVIQRMKEMNATAYMNELFPQAAQAAKAAAYSIAAQWKSYAQGEVLPDGRSVRPGSGGYAASVKVRETSPWDYTIYSDSFVAPFIEDGTDELDMKQTHPFGSKGRVGKRKIPKKMGGGFEYVPYVIIPFRWATPKSGAHFGKANVIPMDVYRKILTNKKAPFQASRKLEITHDESNFWGEMVPRSEYEWGDRLSGAGGNIEGLVRMDTSNPQGRRESNYFTFRVISSKPPLKQKPGAKPWSQTWVKPKTEGFHVAKQTAEKMQKDVNDLIDGGFRSDLEGML